VWLFAPQMDEVPGLKYMQCARRSKLDAAFDALNRDLAGRLVLPQSVTGKQDDANDLQLLCLQKGRRPGAAQLSAERKQADDLTGLRMLLGQRNISIASL
jgi:hypothetical protein